MKHRKLTENKGITRANEVQSHKEKSVVPTHLGRQVFNSSNSGS